jgi:hypothetical protein
MIFSVCATLMPFGTEENFGCFTRTFCEYAETAISEEAAAVPTGPPQPAIAGRERAGARTCARFFFPFPFFFAMSFFS